MKKHLIAAAVAAAVAAPVFAQSNVTIYGRLDAGYGQREDKVGGGATTKTSGVQYANFTSSRLGLLGTEDLGGGLKASFNLEGDLGSSAVTSSTTAGAGFANFGFGSRQQWLNLQGGFGTVLVGKTDAMVKSIYDAFDAGYSNNMIGSVDSMDAATNGTTRRDVTIRYTTPSFSGLTASIGMLKSSSDASNLDGKTEDNTGEEFGLRYASGPFSAGVAYRNADVKVEGTATPGSATSNQLKDLAIGASYNFGPAIVFAQYFDAENKNKVSNAETDEKFYAIGIRVPVGAATIYGSYVDGESKSGATKLDREGYQLGVKYDFSKRTYAYAAYGDDEVNTSAVLKTDRKQFAVGVAHHF